jgi:hypothetical protein
MHPITEGKETKATVLYRQKKDPQTIISFPAYKAGKWGICWGGSATVTVTVLVSSVGTTVQ